MQVNDTSWPHRSTYFMERKMSAQVRGRVRRHVGPSERSSNMMQALFQRVRSFSDALFAGFTRTAPDGRKVIFPWGVFGRAYVIASEDDERRMKQGFAAFLLAVQLLIVVGYALWGIFGSLAAGALVLAGYAIHVKRLTDGMEPSSERLPMAEAYRAQAWKHSPARLWSWIVTGMFCVCFGIIAGVLAPEGEVSVSFFILIGIFLIAGGGYLLALRRGTNPLAATPSPAGESVVAEEVAMYVTGDAGPVRIWFLTITGLVFAGLGVFLFVVDPEGRLAATGLIALFGLIAVFGMALLVLRYRARHG